MGNTPPLKNGVLAKLKFSFKVEARMENVPQTYMKYVEDKVFMRNKEVERKGNFFKCSN
jgi:hypothetical protein